MAKIDINYPVSPVQPGNVKKELNTHHNTTTTAFKHILQQEINRGKIKFSGHSLKRMEQNNISLSSAQMEKLEQAINKVEAKGARDSLVIMDNVALVVSIKNRTVITAVGNDRMKDNVFTKIDSAVFI